MVIPDLSAPNYKSIQTAEPASALDRFLAGVFDILLLVPIATLVPSIHIREARLDFLQGFESNIWQQVVLLWILTYVIVQSTFLYFLKSTPGGMIMHTRIQSLSGKLTWNQCLLRATFSLLSWFVLCLPFLEVITHPVKRAWHDRVSDTIVVDLKNKPAIQIFPMNTQVVRAFMTLGIFFILMASGAYINQQNELSYISESGSVDSTDSFVAQALLKKDYSESTRNEVEKRIWGSDRKREKSLAYFFKLQIEQNQDIKEVLVQQICQWSPSEKAGTLCSLAKYSLKNDDKSLQSLTQNLNDVQGLTAKVYLLKELTRNSQFAGALTLYKQLKKQASVSFKDSLKIWDVSLFWALRENQLKAKRVPANADESSAIKEYIQDRGAP